MCRLALMNVQWLNQVKIEELSGLFTTLDERNGGNGVGLALHYEKNPPVIYKGVNIRPFELACIAYGEKDNPDLTYIVYHTRLATSGTTSDDMCHPFSEETLTGLTFAHNGVIHSLSGSDRYSDSKILFDLITKYQMPMSTLSSMSGVFVGVLNGLPFVVKSASYSDLTLCYSEDYQAWCFCSSFYQYTPLLKERFQFLNNLDTFTWTTKLTAKTIKLLRRTYNYPIATTNHYTKKNTTDYGYNETPVNSGSGYRDLKKRNYNGNITYHDFECRDWYCEGDCVSIQDNKKS